MTDSKELVPFNVSLPVVSDEQMETFDEMAKGADFLQRIQLIGKGRYVDEGLCPPGHWGVPINNGDDIHDLGVTIDIVPLAYRPKALDVSDKEAIVAVFDISDPEFSRIKHAPKNTGCMWGPSFLVLERSTGVLYELFFGNKSGRAEAGKMRPFLPSEAQGPQPVTLKIRYKKGKDFSWHVPVITKCSEPFSEQEMNISQEKIKEELEKFLNPKTESLEKVEEKDDEEEAY